MQKLKSQLKKICEREKLVVDIILFGSAVREKAKPNDVDVAVLFREENYEEMDRVSYEIKKLGDSLDLNLHIEPLAIDNIHTEPVYLSLIHEGFSVRHGDFINKKLKTESMLLVTYSLKNLTHSQKTLFGYALKGRKEGAKSILRESGGEAIGRNNILVPVEKSEKIRSFLDSWKKISYKTRRVIVI